MADWVIGLMEQGGYATIAALMFLENLFPPVPSELIMPLAGYTAHRGDLSIAPVVAAGSLGSLAGALIWYFVGLRLGCECLKGIAARHGRWLTLSPEEIDRADAWFGRHGAKAVLIGRLVPAVRTLISIPAGLSGMSLRRFLVYTSIGTVIWTTLLAGAGWVLGSSYDQVSIYLGPVSNAVAAAIVLWYLYRVATFQAGRRQPDGERKTDRP